MAKVGSGHKNKHLPKFNVSPSRRGCQGCQGPEMQADSLPGLFFASLSKPGAAVAASSTWVDGGWVSVVGPHGAWEEMKVKRFFLLYK